MIFNRLLTTCVALILCVIAAMAQKMSVADFTWEQTDMTAKTSGTERFDLNGSRCALIKIETVVQGLTFDVGSSGVTEIQAQNADHPSEVWLYVPFGVKTISIQAPGYNAITDYDLGMSLKRGETYRLSLTADEVNSFVANYDKTQTLNVSVIPADEATLQINGVAQSRNRSGEYSLTLPFGKHMWRVTAPNWHTKEGKINIDNPDHPHTLNVQLSPAFGFLSIAENEDNGGASVYIDDKEVGKVPLKDIRVPSGNHTLSVRKKLFETYTQKFAISDSTYISQDVELTPCYGMATLTASKGNIYVDNEYVGTLKWTGKFEPGTHKVEVRLDKHHPSLCEITVVRDGKITQMLEEPRAMVGNISITSTPSGVDVYLKGKKLGATPLTLSDYLIGDYEFDLQRDDCKPNTARLSVAEGTTASTHVTLDTYCTAYVTVNPSDAKVYVDDTEQDFPGSFRLRTMPGLHTFEASAPGYLNYSRTKKLDANTKDFEINLRKNYVSNTNVYVGAAYDFLKTHDIHIMAGTYMGGLNFEGFLGIHKSDSIPLYIKNPNAYQPVEPVCMKYGISGGVRVGWGIRIGARLQLTPQIGINGFELKDSNYKIPGKTDSNGNPKTLTVCNYNFTAGAKISLALARGIHIFAQPEYNSSIYKSPGYTQLMDFSQKATDLIGEGLRCRAGITLLIPADF